MREGTILEINRDMKFGLIKPRRQGEKTVLFQKRTTRGLSWDDIKEKDEVRYEVSSESGTDLLQFATLVTTKANIDAVNAALARGWKSGVVASTDKQRGFGVILVNDDQSNLFDATTFVVFTKTGRDAKPVIQEPATFDTLAVGSVVEFKDFQVAAESGDRIASKVRMLQANAARPASNLESFAPAASGIKNLCSGTVISVAGDNGIPPAVIKADGGCEGAATCNGEFTSKNTKLKDQQRVTFVPVVASCTAINVQ
ncbi:MAG: hypothetical protein KDA66_12375 [Planctomycetaceae bacterium]|nr:hypothetical protein [Planctomycetaceae bacterium]